MVDFEFGVLNWLLTYLHVGDFNHHDWFASTWSGWAVITSLVVWGAIPFVTLMVFAGLTQVPQELIEAATTDGASPWRVLPRRDDAAAQADLRDPDEPLDHLGLPGLQPDLDPANGQPPPEYFTMSIYAFTTSFQQSQYGLGSAIALVMVAILLVVSFVYIRQMVKIGDAE